MQSKKEMPLEHKPILTIREASFIQESVKKTD